MKLSVAEIDYIVRVICRDTRLLLDSPKAHSKLMRKLNCSRAFAVEREAKEESADA